MYSLYTGLLFAEYRLFYRALLQKRPISEGTSKTDDVYIISHSTLCFYTGTHNKLSTDIYVISLPVVSVEGSTLLTRCQVYIALGPVDP